VADRKPPEFRERSMAFTAADVSKIWYWPLVRTSIDLHPAPSLPSPLRSSRLWVVPECYGCLYVPMLVIYNVTWSVNSICHMPAARDTVVFDTSDRAENNFLDRGARVRRRIFITIITRRPLALPTDCVVGV